MKRWIPGRLLMLCLGLALQPGCSTFQDLMALPDLGQHELPPKEAGRVCFSVASLEETQGHPAEAIAHYEKARRYDPSLHDVSRHLAVLYDRMGNAEAALTEYRRAIEANPRDADLHNDLGYFYYQRGKWSEAEGSFRAALAINAEHRRAWNNLGMTLAQEHNYDESLAAFMKAVNAADAYCNLGFVYMTQGNHEEASRAYRLALEVEPGLELAQSALARLEATPK